MRAVVCDAPSDDLSGVSVREVPVPVPGPGEALVRVAAASIGFQDILMCQGRYQHRPDPPFAPGMALAGEVVAPGPGAGGVAAGDEVVGSVRAGAFAQYAVVDAAALSPRPAGLDMARAAAFPSAYLTARVALARCARLAAGETVLVHGAAGGVGLAAVDLARLLGARVIATATGPARVAALRDYGVGDAIDAAGGFAERVKALTGGRGADVVFDPVGGDAFDESTRCVAFGGRILVVGFTSGRFAALRTNIALVKGFSVVGVRAGEHGRRFPEQGREDRRAVRDLAEAGRLDPRVHAELPLGRVLDAFAMLAERKAVGKVVLRPWA